MTTKQLNLILGTAWLMLGVALPVDRCFDALVAYAIALYWFCRRSSR